MGPGEGVIVGWGDTLTQAFGLTSPIKGEESTTPPTAR
jgi:hypothetical protein